MVKFNPLSPIAKAFNHRMRSFRTLFWLYWTMITVRFQCIMEKLGSVFSKVSIEHLFGNLSLLVWKKCGKALVFWIQKSVLTLFTVMCTVYNFGNCLHCTTKTAILLTYTCSHQRLNFTWNLFLQVYTLFLKPFIWF